MLSETRKKLETLYAGGKHRGLDGQLHSLNPIVRTAWDQGEIIARLHRETRSELSVEIGLCYGFSSLFILDAMQEGGYGHHISIDPDKSHGVGARAIQEAGLSERFEWVTEYSAVALTDMIKAGRRAQFIYVDGSHHFDSALVDFFLSDQILDTGGLIAMDDMWMPSIQKVVAFISANLNQYTRRDVGYGNLAVFQKTGPDKRLWDHFSDF